VRLWNTRLGALVALIALVVAPAARAGCAARCAAPARPAAAPPDAATGVDHQHAHHHGPRADATPTPGAAVRDARCGPADGRGCLVVRDPTAAPAGRGLQDVVFLAAHVAAASPVVPPAAARATHRTPPIRPPGPISASLPLRI
jgi:hypothetical protein